LTQRLRLTQLKIAVTGPAEKSLRLETFATLPCIRGHGEL
jgi:hypothetical protein